MPASGARHKPKPVLIDTDMGVDDAVAIALALASRELEVRALVSTGGNVDLEQATTNLVRLLAALKPGRLPMIGRGLDQPAGRSDARHVFGADGLGEIDLPAGDGYEVRDWRDVYGEFLSSAADGLHIVAIGPLTTLAEALRAWPKMVGRIEHITIMGGALWCPGNVGGVAEFNFYRDPEAAAAVLGAGLPTTLVTLDVTRFVALDESHAAHLAAGEATAGRLIARMLEFPIRHSTEAGAGRFLVHDALAVGALIWPDLFVRTRMNVAVETKGPGAGRSLPRLAAAGQPAADVLTTVCALDFLEDMLERLCQEEFVV